MAPWTPGPSLRLSSPPQPVDALISIQFGGAKWEKTATDSPGLPVESLLLFWSLLGQLGGVGRGRRLLLIQPETDRATTAFLLSNGTGPAELGLSTTGGADRRHRRNGRRNSRDSLRRRGSEKDDMGEDSIFFSGAGIRPGGSRCGRRPSPLDPQMNIIHEREGSDVI